MSARGEKRDSDLVGTKTVEFFINKKNGVKKEEVIKKLMKFINMSRKDAELSIKQAVNFGDIIEKDGKLFERGLD